MNGWQAHGIKHSSVSQINSWEGNPALWMLEKLHKIKRPASAAMWRGIVVEDACAEILTTGEGIKEATNKCLIKFDKQIGLLSDEKSEKERAAIPDMVELAVDQLAKFGKPDFSVDGGQQKVTIDCKGDGWTLPIIGFLDFVYPEHGLVVDLKTTMKMPSKMSAGHRRQRCFYEKCMGNISVKFLYVTPKKTGWLEDGDVEEELAAIKATLNRQEKFLALGDKDLLTSIVPVDPGHFFWGGAVEERKKYFGVQLKSRRMRGFRIHNAAKGKKEK